MEDHRSDCNSHDDLYFLCGHREESDNPEQVRYLKKAFRLCAYPMTNRLYFLFDVVIPIVDRDAYTKYSPYWRGPVIFRTWYDATMASIFFHGRLSSEWEWEYASRGKYEKRKMEYEDDVENRREVEAWVYPASEQPKFFWKGGEDQLKSYAWIYENSATKESVSPSDCLAELEKVDGWHAHIVGKEAHRNDMGLYDMLGNVYEWTSGRYHPNGVSRSVRGGGFGNSADLACCSCRVNFDPMNASLINGFRIARAKPENL